MLQGLNKAGQSVAGRIVVAIMFGFLIVSFAIWGIGDIFRGGVRTQVATVGKQDVSAEAFRTAYQSEYQALLRRVRTTITPDQARALGLDNRVLGRLVTEAALDQKARNLGLSAPDDLVVRSIQADPSFQAPGGGFDRGVFNELLRSNGLSEAQYVRDQRGYAVRIQLAEAVSGGLVVPLAMREAVHRYTTERRAADYVEVTAAALGAVPAPTDEQLRTFYDGRKSSYRAPEYRAATLLVLDAAALAKPEAVSDADARAAYDRSRDERYGQPEKRTVEQIVFPDKTAAEAAFARIRAGTAFDEIARELKIEPANLELGTFTKAEMFDPVVADAAFALADGAVSGPVEGRFGTVLVRVSGIVPGTTKPFADVLPAIREAVATERAQAELQRVHDAIEDARASGKPLAEVARERGLPLRTIGSIDRQGQAADGKPVDGLPDAQGFVPALFRSDVGADTEAVSLRGGGYAWFEVTGVTPARDRPLDEVKDKVAADWRSDWVETALGDRARDLAGKVSGGATLDDVAREAGLTVSRASDLARGAAAGDLPATVVARIFATPVGQAADASATPERRIVFAVRSATVPPFVTTTQAASDVAERLRTSLSEDLLSEYIAVVEKEIGVSVYPENMRRAIGGDS